MDRPTLTVADIFRRYGDAYREHAGPALPLAHRRVMTALEQCRTAALGGHVEQCDACAHRRVWYNSCRNRHCPTCQSLARASWIEDRTADLLDTQYFHVVFTVPQAIAEIAAQNKAVVYNILFRTTADTLRTTAVDVRLARLRIGVRLIACVSVCDRPCPRFRVALHRALTLAQPQRRAPDPHPRPRRSPAPGRHPIPISEHPVRGFVQHVFCTPARRSTARHAPTSLRRAGEQNPLCILSPLPPVRDL